MDIYPLEIDPHSLVACYAMFSVEFTGQCLLICVSLFVLAAVCRCSVLHANLKVFLVLKCVASVVMGCCRISSLLLHIAFQTPMYSLSIHASFLMHISSSINAYLSIGYATERMLATVMVKRYEKQRPFYGFAFTALLLCITVYNAGSDYYWHPGTLASGFSMSTIITTYGTNGIGIVCLLIVCMLHRYNRRRYFTDFHNGTFGHLSGRYQNLENIRTTRQLIPVIFLHILAGLHGSLFIASLMLFPLTPDDTFYRLMSTNIINCSIYLLCQAAVLHFHPVLRMDTYTFLRRSFGCLCRLQGTGRVTPLERPTGIVVENAATTPIEEGSVYFQTLADAWDRLYDTNHAQKK